MIFQPTPLRDAYTVAWEPRSDNRGFFARAFCADEFNHQGLCSSFVQANISDNIAAATIRGMHFQTPPHDEVKLVRCVRGAIYDVIVDIRPESPTYLKWFAAHLSATNGLMMYVPKGFAHGYQTTTDNATTLYFVSDKYMHGAEAGLRYDDPALAIAWPLPASVVSEKDHSWPLLSNENVCHKPS